MLPSLPLFAPMHENSGKVEKVNHKMWISCKPCKPDKKGRGDKGIEKGSHTRAFIYVNLFH